VGRDLGVEAVLTGRVSQRGDALVIGAELVDVARGTRLWGERYNTRMGDIFAVQEDIARDISRGLRLKLATRAETLPTRRHIPDPEAYRLNLLSRHELNKPFTSQGVKRALEYAQQATENDPTYAPAYAVLARAYIRLGEFDMLHARQAHSRAKTAATKALEIDPTLPEGHLALAYAAHLGWDWAGAQRGFERAIELDPNSADSHAAYGRYLMEVGRRPREAIEHMRRAVELDPMSSGRRANLGWAYYYDRQYDEAIGMGREALEFGRDPIIMDFRVLSYREKGMYEEAIAEMRKQPRPAIALLSHLGNTYARAGGVGEARECLRKLKERARDSNVVGAYATALIHAGLGEKDEAFKWLERAYEELDKGMAFLRVDPTLDPLRSDPRFQDLLRRMNFPIP
jgi:tetratricopeptide (TPR) repeat protein